MSPSNQGAEAEDVAGGEPDESQFNALKSTTVCAEKKPSRSIVVDMSTSTSDIETSTGENNEPIQPLAGSEYAPLMETEVVDGLSQTTNDSEEEVSEMAPSNLEISVDDPTDLSMVHRPLESQVEDELGQRLEQHLESASAIEMEVISRCESNVLRSSQDPEQASDE